METVLHKYLPGPVDIRKLEYERVCDDEEDIPLKVQSDHQTIPYFVNPFILPNAGIYLSYFNVGVAMYILHAPIAYYLIHILNVSATQYSAYSTLVLIPWSLKFLFGVISDTVPIAGYRRKSWMFISWLLFVLIIWSLASRIEPSFIETAVLMFALTCSYLLGDVCHDALCVERSRLEPEAVRGTFQTGAYSIRSFGGIVGAILGSLLFNTADWGWGLTVTQLCMLVGVIPLVTLLPSLWSLEELASRKPVPSVPEIATDTWNTLKLRAVWHPTIFIFTYYALQVPNAAWTNFLVEGEPAQPMWCCSYWMFTLHRSGVQRFPDRSPDCGGCSALLAGEYMHLCHTSSESLGSMTAFCALCRGCSCSRRFSWRPRGAGSSASPCSSTVSSRSSR